MSKTETQSKALRLAELLEKGNRRQGDVRIAAVLRGLDAENKALRDALDAVALDAISLGNGENAISDATREKVEAALKQSFAAQAEAMTGDAA